MCLYSHKLTGLKDHGPVGPRGCQFIGPWSPHGLPRDYGPIRQIRALQPDLLEDSCRVIVRLGPKARDISNRGVS